MCPLTFFELDIAITLHSQTCNGSGGLCGTCESFKGPDIIQTKSKDIVAMKMQQSKVHSFDTVFIYNKEPFYEPLLFVRLWLHGVS